MAVVSAKLVLSLIAASSITFESIPVASDWSHPLNTTCDPPSPLLPLCAHPPINPLALTSVQQPVKIADVA